MTPLEAAETLAAIRYKPNWKLGWEFAWAGDGLSIHWYLTVPDANNSDANPIKMTSAWVHLHLDNIDEEGIVREAHRLAVRAEIHEANEFFTYKGARPFDPHRSVLNEGERYG